MVEMLTVQTELLSAQWQKCVPADGACCEEYCTDTLVNTLQHLILRIVGGLNTFISHLERMKIRMAASAHRHARVRHVQFLNSSLCVWCLTLMSQVDELCRPALWKRGYSYDEAAKLLTRV